MCNEQKKDYNDNDTLETPVLIKGPLSALTIDQNVDPMLHRLKHV